jgi:2-polyprenyl-6-methoxyphenol hydroxylase-like FAD-dependent oxidoreductase
MSRKSGDRFCEKDMRPENCGFDVLIAGAGPAGAATAISLADFAPPLRVGLVGVPATDAVRVGETLPPQIKPVLEHLKVWQAFEADRHRPSYRTVSAWGGVELLSNEFLFQTHQVGWRLDRACFDATLLAKAAKRATHIARQVTEAAWADGAWCVRLDDGASHAARFLVDATGRGAALARQNGVRFENLDRLAGSVMLFDQARDDGVGLLIETFSDGWWYTAALPGGRRIVAAMSDADLVRPLGLNRSDGFMQALGATRHVSQALAAARPLAPPVLRPAGSRHITRDTALPLLCVGDAATCFDPVSGQGIFKALRCGIFASYAIGDHLRGDDTGLKRYRRFIADEFAGYRKTLREYYAMEQRWAERVFWRKRMVGVEDARESAMQAVV